MPSTSWNRLFRCFGNCRVEVRGILFDTVFGEGDRLGVDFSEFPEALPVCLLVVPAGGNFSCTGVDLLLLTRRQPVFYLRQVGCVVRFWRFKFLLRVVPFPRIAALPS